MDAILLCLPNLCFGDFCKLPAFMELLFALTHQGASLGLPQNFDMLLGVWAHILRLISCETVLVSSQKYDTWTMTSWHCELYNTPW